MMTRTRSLAGFTTSSPLPLYTYTQDMAEQSLTKEQEDLVGKGYAGPPVALDNIPVTDAQALLVLCLRLC